MQCFGRSKLFFSKLSISFGKLTRNLAGSNLDIKNVLEERGRPDLILIKSAIFKWLTRILFLVCASILQMPMHCLTHQISLFFHLKKYWPSVFRYRRRRKGGVWNYCQQSACSRKSWYLRPTNDMHFGSDVVPQWRFLASYKGVRISFID